MLESDLSPRRATALAAELRDALGRRQKELPARWLAPSAASRWMTANTIRERSPDAEATVGLAVLERYLSQVKPRGVVCIQPSGSPASAPLLDAVREHAGVVRGVVIEWDLTLARHAARWLEGGNDGGRDDRLVVTPLAADCTVNLSLPSGFPRPRVYLCVGNALGAVTAVGTIRMLRVLRATMRPGDTLVLGLAVASSAIDGVNAHAVADPDRHLDALQRINVAFGSAVDLERFGCESRYDAENRRIETHLVARRSLELEIPGVCRVRLKKGESIRTAVSCTFDRPRVAAMLGGVGLSLFDWEQHSSGRVAVAAASPATC